MPILLAATLATCTPALIYDADTFTCADGTKLRVAGVNSRELKGVPCPGDYPCPAMSAIKARDVTVRLLGATVVGKRPTGHLIVRAPAIRYQEVDRSHNRLVARIITARGHDLRCGLQAAGAVAAWPKFVRRYRLRPCR